MDAHIIIAPRGAVAITAANMVFFMRVIPPHALEIVNFETVAPPDVSQCESPLCWCLVTNPFEHVGRQALTYVDVRPGYPATLLDRALDGIRPGGRVADIGAGTGKLTGELVGRGYATWAVEPSSDMRTTFALAHPDFRADRLCGTTAEATGLESASFDLVTYAQSWHWVDDAAGSAELARILAPGGRVAILFNQLDVAVPWVKRLTRIMRSGDVHRLDRPPKLGKRFTKPELVRTSFVDRLTPDQVVELGTTRASWLRSDESNRRRMTANLRQYLDEFGYVQGTEVELPYLSMVWLAEKR